MVLSIQNCKHLNELKEWGEVEKRGLQGQKLNGIHRCQFILAILVPGPVGMTAWLIHNTELLF